MGNRKVRWALAFALVCAGLSLPLWALPLVGETVWVFFIACVAGWQIGAWTVTAARKLVG